MAAIVAGQQFQERMEKVTLQTAKSSMGRLKSAHGVLTSAKCRGGMMAKGTPYCI